MSVKQITKRYFLNYNFLLSSPMFCNAILTRWSLLSFKPHSFSDELYPNRLKKTCLLRMKTFCFVTRLF